MSDIRESRAAFYRQSGLWNDDTLWSLIAAQARSRGDAPAIIAGGSTRSWSEFQQQSEAVASGLVGLGIGPGDVVSVQLPNIAEFLIALAAVARLGAVTNTIHMPYGPREAAELMGHAESHALICLDSAGARRPAADMLARADSLPALKHVIAVGTEPPPGSVPFGALGASGGAPLPPPPGPDDPCLLLFTSGTSANPKGVLAPHRQYLSNARANVSESGLDARSVMMSAPPFSHLLGLYTFFLMLYAGGPNLLLPSFAPPAFVETILEGGPTCVFTAPAHVAACEMAGLLPEEGFPSVRYAIISGSKAAPDLYRRFQAYLPNGVVGQLWGMTEMQCGLFTRPDEPLERAANWCGRASVGTEVRICGPDDIALPDGEEGELQVTGCSVFDGYYRNASANAAAFTADGWFRTGDLAVRDAEGFVAITGRNKDIINRGGVKINPADVEEAIDRHPQIVQSAIVPMPDAVLGEKACCFAVAAPGHAPALDDITAWLAAEGIAKLKWPERLVLVDELPLTPTRKVIKGRLTIPD